MVVSVVDAKGNLHARDGKYTQKPLRTGKDLDSNMPAPFDLDAADSVSVYDRLVADLKNPPTDGTKYENITQYQARELAKSRSRRVSSDARGWLKDVAATPGATVNLQWEGGILEASRVCIPAETGIEHDTKEPSPALFPDNPYRKSVSTAFWDQNQALDYYNLKYGWGYEETEPDGDGLYCHGIDDSRDSAVFTRETNADGQTVWAITPDRY